MASALQLVNTQADSGISLPTPPVIEPQCSVAPLPEIDSEALAFEERTAEFGAVSLAGLTPPTFAALSKFRSLVESVGGSLTLTSAYRPLAYQQHLQAVWDQWQALRANIEPGCGDQRQQAWGEFTRHGLLPTQRPVDYSDHTFGIGFDAAVALPALRGRSRQRKLNLDKLARQAGILRPAAKRDPVHFRLIGPRPAIVALAD